MPYLNYRIRPVEHAMSTATPSLFTPPGFSPWVLNGRIAQASFKKRPGYSLDRTIGRPVYAVVLYQLLSGTRYTLYLTDTDICKKETATGKTFSYLTETYTTGTSVALDGTKLIVTGTGTSWYAAGVAAGDYFIIDGDHTSDAEGPTTPWASIKSVNVSGTEIILNAAYAGTQTTGTHKIRKVYAVPANERWSWALVNNKLCFTCGTTDVLYWGGTGKATSLDSTNAKEARYALEYANRLFIADTDAGSTRRPLTIKWSKEGDPTNWTDTTSGAADLLETDDYITGLGKVQGQLVVYKKENIFFYKRSGYATAPISRTYDNFIRGIGCIAPYSIVEFMGTNAFLGRDDFYIISGTNAIPVGMTDKPKSVIREKFFEIVSDVDAEKVWGFAHPTDSVVHWIANTSEGKLDFVWDWKHNEWTVDSYADNVSGFGKGAV